jgi:hypothetical protein
MKYIAGKTTTFKWDTNTSISVIGNHTLVLVGIKGAAVLLLEDGGRQLLIDTIDSLPDEDYDNPVSIGPYDRLYLTIESHSEFLMLSVGEVVSFICKVNEDVDILVSILKGPAPTN